MAVTIAKEQVFQLKLASLDIATRPENSDPGTTVDKAQVIYDYLTAEVQAPGATVVSVFGD